VFRNESKVNVDVGCDDQSDRITVTLAEPKRTNAIIRGDAIADEESVAAVPAASHRPHAKRIADSRGVTADSRGGSPGRP